MAQGFGDNRDGIDRLENTVFDSHEHYLRELCYTRQAMQDIASRCFGALDDLKKVECPLREAKSLVGIITHLTNKCGGNVCNKGLVRITASSSYSGNVANIADLATDSAFRTGNAPGQWICWEFRDAMIRPTHYTIRSYLLRSWVVETSVDEENWERFDYQKENAAFKSGWNTASFARSGFHMESPGKCRFIRLSIAGKTHSGDDFLELRAFEIFGALFE
jgi:hypothetical protein